MGILVQILVTGATGFIGQSVIRTALARGHTVTALARDIGKARACLPVNNPSLKIRICRSLDDFQIEKDIPDRIIHLAWNFTHKYTDAAILTQNLNEQFSFLRRAIEAGVTDITVAGTCQEYGMKEGRLCEEDEAAPGTYYALAKSLLYRMLEMMPAVRSDTVRLKWLRYFYVYGQRQNPRSLFPQLISAIERGDKTFNMSSGDQERDFLHIDTLAHNTVAIAEQQDVGGIINVGSGRGVKIIDFVNDILHLRKTTMELNRGFYPTPAYEPFSFYAAVTKLKTISGCRIDDHLFIDEEERVDLHRIVS